LNTNSKKKFNSNYLLRNLGLVNFTTHRITKSRKNKMNRDYNFQYLLISVYSFPSSRILAVPLTLPVRLAAIRPTLRPADVSRRTVEGKPIC